MGGTIVSQNLVNGEGSVQKHLAFSNYRKGQIVHGVENTRGLSQSVHRRKDLVQRPDEKAVDDLTEQTRAALERRIAAKLGAANPQKTAANAARHDNVNNAPTIIKYTPVNQRRSGAQRLISIVDKPVDPLEPPKHRFKRAPPGPPSPPVPVVHSPERELTRDDVRAFDIPPCVSNWKNARGFVHSLDKRLAADGRGLQQPVINDKFATFAESLYIAERNAREEVERHNQLREALKRKEVENQEEQLKKIARISDAKIPPTADPDDYSSSSSSDEGEDDVVLSREEREKIRHQQRRERERERRMQAMGAKSRLARQERRDVSERVALGMEAGVAKDAVKGSEGLFDQRLFNQATNVSSNFGAEDGYNIYEKPLFKGSSANQIYRPSESNKDDQYGSKQDLNALKDTSRFRPDQGFSGAETDQQSRRSGPVKFERDTTQRRRPRSPQSPTTLPQGKRQKIL
eukprot:CAMPEP_0201553552 /NCGR_PEP_ID=MMETSP0173_2-20130828/30451_1 /ASSEMBLY_ACC=CAM_ASM_000268 /TAXON_ID=218659 /ORGANISM="Vexillifera sp., Strain DIVA3 564/2" /LENGTH=459 /DNA_ID=CAMNT_0047964403 /DNA_START=30 /DNA_END=1406 /DNA_ORIENTATION=+